MRVLIIEDEKKAARELQSLILQVKPEWNIIGIIPSVAEAIEWFAENKMPDLIFSDIQLTDAACFNIFERVTIECPIIFCTAYDEYAIKSFETSSIDYLLKPIDKRKLERALLKLDKMNAMFGKSADAYVDLGKLIQELLPNNNRTLLIHHKETIIPVSYSDVAWFHYDQAVVTVKLISGQSYHISQGIDQIEAGADARLFYRANR